MISLPDSWFLTLALKPALLLLAASAACWIMRRAPAALRHAIWASSFVGLLLLPFLSLSLPAWEPPVTPALLPALQPGRIVIDVTAARADWSTLLQQLALIVWSTGALAVLADLLIGWVRLRNLTATARPFPGAAADVWLSRQVALPVVCGIFRPRILLPKAALRWPAARLRLVLAHERMHLERQDTRIHLLARIGCALYWFHPLVWWAAGRLRREAEQASDDGVIAQGEQPSTYAHELVEIARGLAARQPVPQGGLTMAQTHLEHRLKALLATHTNRRPPTSRAIGLVAITAAAILLPLSALRAPAQQTGEIAGIVRDASGAAVPRANIAVVFRDSDRKEFTISGPAGTFSLGPLQAGSYEVVVTHPGFARLRLESIQIADGQRREIFPVLNVGQINESIDVQAERPQLVPTAGGMPQRLRVGGKVQRAKMIAQPAPVYPSDCKSEGVQGTVLLQAVVGTDGGILNLEPINQLVDARLVQAAMDAVRLWRYEPTHLNGVPVEVLTEVQVNFTLTP